MAFTQPALGNRLITVGKSERDAGDDLLVVATNLGNVAEALTPDGQVSKSLKSIRKGLIAVRGLLAPVVTALNALASVLNDFTVPTVTPIYSTYNIFGLGNL